jgi:hypothetical protein
VFRSVVVEMPVPVPDVEEEMPVPEVEGEGTSEVVLVEHEVVELVYGGVRDGGRKLVVDDSQLEADVSEMEVPVEYPVE